jgi:hypothetical protein
MWMTTTIAVVTVLALALVVALGMYLWAHVVPPLEAEPTNAGLRVVVHRAMLRDVEISVNQGPSIGLGNLPRGVTILPWSDFGLTATPSLHEEVRQVDATGMSRFSRFETSVSFTDVTQTSATTSQFWKYVSTAE